MALTMMWRGASSAASWRVIAWIAAFDGLYE
jgi:hypothetical protein